VVWASFLIRPYCAKAAIAFIKCSLLSGGLHLFYRQKKEKH
jgi:hypothetical protein